MKRSRVASILMILLILAAAQAVFGAGTKERRLNLNLREMPFPEAIRYILSGSDYEYSVSPALNDLKVTATLQNVTRDEAIKVVTKTAGVIYSVDKSKYTFEPDPNVVSVRGGSTQSSGSAMPSGPLAIELITLRYISAGDAASLLNASPPDGLQSITATSVNTLMIKGDENAIKQSKEFIKLFDVETALPRSVRVTLSVWFGTAGSKDPISVTTESVGPEGSQMPLNINFSGKEKGTCLLDARLTPAVLPDDSISLTGSGAIDCARYGSETDIERFSKSFEVAAPATPGVAVVIASGSADGPGGKVEFVVSAIVTIEKGRVVLPKGGLSTPGTRSAVPAQMPRSTFTASAPNESDRKAADALLQQIWAAQPGQPKFDAIDAVVAKYKASDIATRNAIGWLCVTYMTDRKRAVLDRWPCEYVISRCGYEQGMSMLIDELLQDEVEAMRAVAAEALGGWYKATPNTTIHDALVKAAGTDTSKWVRETIARYVSKTPD